MFFFPVETVNGWAYTSKGSWNNLETAYTDKGIQEQRETESASIFYKEQTSKYLRPCEVHSLCHNCSILPCSMKATVDNM